MPSEVLHCLTMWHGSSEALLFLPAWHFGTPVDGTYGYVTYGKQEKRLKQCETLLRVAALSYVNVS